MMLCIFRTFATSSVKSVGRQTAKKPYRRNIYNELKQKLPPLPGVSRRLAAMQEDGVDFAVGPDMELQDYEDVDFQNVHLSHKQHEQELQKNKDLLQLRIAKQKYFSEPELNFLTWSEKEHIRHLHSKFPMEWPPEKIAESFPTSVEGAKKLLKVVWKPATQNRIDRHDASTFRNWKELKEGSLTNVSPELKEHILKFSNRTIPSRSPESDTETKELTAQNMKFGEYSNLITKYNKVTEKESTDIEKISEKVTENFTVNKHVTFDVLRQTIADNVKDPDSISLQDKLILSSDNDYKPDTVKVPIETPSTAVLHNHNFKENLPSKSLNATTVTDSEKHLIYPARIRIPKKSYKRGVTYKVNDCFYDDDGQFLYRVPGMGAIATEN